MEKFSRNLLIAGMVLLCNGNALTNASAAESHSEFTMEPMVITAAKYAKRDVETAASVEIITREELENSGTTNVVTALANVLGVTFMGYGPEGSSIGNKNSNLIIRGMEKGTLVLINGSPVNMNGRYNLEDMTFDGIEKIEVVRGGGSILYGSEAIGGVINIITTAGVKNRIKVSVGGRDRQQYSGSVQLNKISVATSYKHWGGLSKSSDLLTSSKKMNNYMKDMYKDSIYLNYNFDDKSNIMYQHTDSKKDYDYVFGDGYQGNSYFDKTRYNRVYRYRKNFLQYSYNDGDLRSTIYYNDAVGKNDGIDYYFVDRKTGKAKLLAVPKISRERDKNYAYGFDVNKIWNDAGVKYLLGVTYQREMYAPDTFGSDSWKRNNYSVYAQYDRPFDKKNKLLLSARQNWSKHTDGTITNFSGQLQHIYQFSRDESVYFSLGQSFRMPYLRELYASGKGYLAGNNNLRPEKGIHYEVGWKKEVNRHLWKAAFFKYNIKDNISYTLDSKTGTSYSTNQDVKNSGVEVSLHYKNPDGFNYKFGVYYGDPLVKTKKEVAPPGVKVKDYWDRQFGRVQLTGGIGYIKGKWNANIYTSYVCKRVASPSSSASFNIKPYLLSSLSIKYSPDKNSTMTLSMENILNREDNFGGSTTAYYSTPRSYLLSYTYNF